MRKASERKFDPDDRVKPTKEALGMKLEKPKTIGTVVSISKLLPHMIDILRDGTKTPVRYHHDFWEKI